MLLLESELPIAGLPELLYVCQVLHDLWVKKSVVDANLFHLVYFTE